MSAFDDTKENLLSSSSWVVNSLSVRQHSAFAQHLKI